VTRRDLNLQTNIEVSHGKEELLRQICEDAGFDTDVMTLKELCAAVRRPN
jgi:predicted lipid carrier protein YhbT